MYNVIYGYRRKVDRRSSFLASGFILFNKVPHLAGYKDITSSGAGVITKEPLPINAQAKLALNTKRKGLILVEGKVCWCKRQQQGWRSGICFNRVLSFEPTMIA